MVKKRKREEEEEASRRITPVPLSSRARSSRCEGDTENSWKFQPDYFGVADIAHFMLFGGRPPRGRQGKQREVLSQGVHQRLHTLQEDVGGGLRGSTYSKEGIGRRTVTIVGLKENAKRYRRGVKDGKKEPLGCVEEVGVRGGGDTGWFEEFKKLETHNALTALGQVIVYGEKLELRTGQRLKSRIVFFAQGDRNDAKQTFEKIIDDYKNQGVHLDEVVLVHADLDVENHDAKLVQLGCTDLKGGIDWTEEEEVGV
ncbi:hypothetical protein TrCOL_g2593 [Triparma columacea]|uniref:Uncharacterized protein n=1 Tax=Triparma columacea TaxID=722753 RepID=A0A9W7G4X2_9STRA|nr:hypothetical protein TrCOL_g2593 [Triparma columacea]